MASGSGIKVVFGAIAANLVIGISKFVVFSISGSAAMLAEGIHSMVDSLNGVLLYVGIKKSKIKPSKQFPFGKGKEVYFWSFIVSMLVFLFGGVIAIYEGIHHVIEPVNHKGSFLWNYIVLMIAFIVEGASLLYGIKAFKKESEGKNFIAALRESKDASTIAVILEESAALMGIVIAILGTLITQLTNNPLVDGITSITIGALLLGVAFFLAKETKGLLIGEGVDEEMENEIKSIIIDSKSVLSILDFRTMYLSNTDLLIATHVDLKNNITSGTWEILSKEIEEKIRKKFPEVSYCYIAPIDYIATI